MMANPRKQCRRIMSGSLVWAAMGLIFLPLSYGASSSGATKGTAKKPQTVAEIAQYKGADRQQILEEGARKEGRFVWYTSMNERWSRNISREFQKRYPFIKSELYRATSEDVIQRYVAESKGKRGGADLINVSALDFQALLDEDLLQPFYTPEAEAYTPYLKDPKGFWVSNRINAFSVAYNRNQLKTEDLPKTYEDFLHPRWKGKIAIEESDNDWFFMLMNHWGKQKGTEYFTKLGGQNLQTRRGHSNLLNLLVAGEYPLVLTNYAYLAVNFEEEKKAPVGSYYLKPTPVRTEPTGLPKSANHPFSAMLFMDFLLSKDTQQRIANEGEMAAHPQVKMRAKLASYRDNEPTVFDAAKAVPVWNQYVELYDKLLLKR